MAWLNRKALSLFAHRVTTVLVAGAVLVGSCSISPQAVAAPPATTANQTPAPSTPAGPAETGTATESAQESTVPPGPASTTTATPAPTQPPQVSAASTETSPQDADSSATSSAEAGTAGPFLAVDDVPLSDGHVTSPTTIAVANAGSIEGEVTWLIDDKYAGKDSSAPYTWDASLTLGKHKAKARWITGLTTTEVTSEFTVQTDLNWVAPQEIREEPGKALENLWVTGDNRRPAVPGVYDWSKAGFGGGTVLPADENVRPEAGCRIDPGRLASAF
jgi:hypothetical protein